MKPDARKEKSLTPRQVRQHVALTGMTQGEVAARLGITARALSNYMRDRRIPYPTQYALKALAA